MDFISAQVDQIDTGKGTPLQRSFSDSLSTFSHVPKSKYQEKGTTSNVSRWFVKAPIAGPHLFLFPSLLEPALRPIYMASIVPSYLNFPCLTPVSVPERVLLTAEGDFQRPYPTHLQNRAPIFQLQFPLIFQLPFCLIFQLQFSSWRSFTFEPHVGHHLLWPAEQVEIESGRCTVWGKETRDRIKVLKMGPGDSRLLGSRALFLGATSLLFSVLASRKYLLCYDDISLLCPQSHLPFY